MPTLPTICIFTGDLGKVSETFIRRHLTHLNGGNTVAMARRSGAGAPPGKPVLIYPPRSRLRKWLNRLDRRPLLPGMRPDPFLAEFEQFVRAHGVGFILAEFGTLAPEMFETAEQFDIPMFCYFRGYDAASALRDARYRANLRRAFERIDGIVAVSAFLLDRLADHGLVHRNAMVIPSGVDATAFTPGEKDSSLVLSVGRMVEKKAPLLTIRAFARVARSHADLRLEMIGGGPLLKRARAEVQALGLAGRVLLHGPKSHDFTADRMRAASVHMLHSVTARNGDTEGVPTAVQEAMAAGAAVLSTLHAGIPELVENGVSGLLVEEHDEQGFADALEKLVRDPQLRGTLGRNARQAVENGLDYRHLYGRLETAIAQAIEARRAARGA